MVDQQWRESSSFSQPGNLRPGSSCCCGPWDAVGSSGSSDAMSEAHSTVVKCLASVKQGQTAGLRELQGQAAGWQC